MENQMPINSIPTQTPPQTEAARNKSNSLNIIVTFVFMLIVAIGTNAANYYWQQKKINQQKIQIDELNQNLTAVQQELDLLKNPPISTYCEDGTIYENASYKYKICIPENWFKSTESDGDEDVIIAKSLDMENYIEITVNSDSMETALSDRTSDVFVDTANRNYTVDGIAAIQVTGTVKPDQKRAVTVFTKNYVTYEVLLENADDASYTDNLASYRQIISSFMYSK